MDVALVRRPGIRGGDGRRLKAFVRRVATAAGSEADEVTVVLAGDGEVAELNGRFRGRPRPTDVLSFPGEVGPDGLLRQGEIVISVERARSQAAQRHHDLDTELRYLVLHGFLHLMGYDHETDQGEMAAEEHRLRDALALGRPRVGGREAV